MKSESGRWVMTNLVRKSRMMKGVKELKEYAAELGNEFEKMKFKTGERVTNDGKEVRKKYKAKQIGPTKN